jgi:hypothetical protein
MKTITQLEVLSFWLALLMLLGFQLIVACPSLRVRPAGLTRPPWLAVLSPLAGMALLVVFRRLGLRDVFYTLLIIVGVGSTLRRSGFLP